MAENEVILNLTDAIEQSRHKEFWLSGLSVFSSLLQGENPDLTAMKEPFKTSVKIIAEDVDDGIASNIIARNNTEEKFRRYAGKYVKKELLKTVGATLDPEEREQFEKDKKDLIQFALECVD